MNASQTTIVSNIKPSTQQTKDLADVTSSEVSAKFNYCQKTEYAFCQHNSLESSRACSAFSATNSVSSLSSQENEDFVATKVSTHPFTEPLQNQVINFYDVERSNESCSYGQSHWNTDGQWSKQIYHYPTNYKPCPATANHFGQYYPIKEGYEHSFPNLSGNSYTACASQNISSFTDYNQYQVPGVYNHSHHSF